MNDSFNTNHLKNCEHHDTCREATPLGAGHPSDQAADVDSVRSRRAFQIFEDEPVQPDLQVSLKLFVVGRCSLLAIRAADAVPGSLIHAEEQQGVREVTRHPDLAPHDLDIVEFVELAV